MRAVADDLRGILSKVCDLCFEGEAFVGVFDFIEIDAIFVSERIEDVHVLDCLLAALLVPVNQIDPLLDVLADVGTFQLLP